MVQDSKAKIIFDCYKVPVLVLLTLFVRFMPYGLQQNAIMHKFILPLNVIVVLCAFIIVCNNWVIDCFQVCAALFMAVQILSNLLNGIGIIREIWHLALYASLIIIIIWAVKTDAEKSIEVVPLYFFTVLAANLFTILYFPEGPFQLENGYKCFLLGNHNSYIQPSLILLLFLGITFYDKKNRKWLLWCATWLILFLTYYRERSITSIIGLALLFAYVLLLNKEFSRKIFNIVTYAIANGFVFFYVVVNHITKSDKLKPLMEIFKKSSTLSTRTIIWDEYAEVIPRSLLLGFGNQEQDVLRRMFGDTPAGRMPHAHNLIINTAFQYGLIGLTVLIILFVLVAIELRNINNDRLRYYFETIMGVLLLISQFEMYSFEFYYMVLTLMFTYARKERIENAKPLYTADY